MFARLNDRQSLRRWSRAAKRAQSLDAAALTELHETANKLSKRIEKVREVAKARLYHHHVEAANATGPIHSDWVWCPPHWSSQIAQRGLVRPESGASFGPGAQVFHDCDAKEVSMRQMQTHAGASQKLPWMVRIETYGFEGRYLSLVFDLPAEAVQNLASNHIFALSAQLNLETPVSSYARLNLQQGPNTLRQVAAFDTNVENQNIEFDLAIAPTEEDRIDRAWIDIIFDAPAMSQIDLADLCISRRPRADL